MRTKDLKVSVMDNGDLQVEGLGVVANPLTKLDVGIDLGQLWLALWLEDQHNQPNPARVRAILLNSLNLSVQQVLQAITN